MTLIDFVKSNLRQDTPIGDLCREIEGDLQFPLHKSEEEMVSYLKFRTDHAGIGKMLKRFLRDYEKQRDQVIDTLDVETRFSVLRTENWSFLKNSFSIDKVYLIGHSTDIYKVYCIDSTSQKALLFDIKYEGSLNDLYLRDSGDIFVGNLTNIVTVREAISQLENCSYDTPVKPYMPNFQELITFLKQHV